MKNTWHINIRNAPTTSPTTTTIYPTFRALLFLGQLYVWIIIIQPRPHRTPVALFWDLFRGLHLTSWRWMACLRINYPHDLLGVSETLQPDYPRIPPDHGWSTFSALTHYLQSSPTFCGLHLFLIKNGRGTSLSRIWSPQSFEGLWVNQCSVQLCSVMGYQHLAKLCRLMGCPAT